MAHYEFIFSNSKTDSPQDFWNKLCRVRPPLNWKATFYDKKFSHLWPDFHSPELDTVTLGMALDERIYPPKQYGVWTYEERHSTKSLPEPQAFLKQQREWVKTLDRAGLRTSPDGLIIKGAEGFKGGVPADKMLELIEEATHLSPPDPAKENPTDRIIRPHLSPPSDEPLSPELQKVIDDWKSKKGSELENPKETEAPKLLTACCRKCQMKTNYPSRPLSALLQEEGHSSEDVASASLSTESCIFCSDTISGWTLL